MPSVDVVRHRAMHLTEDGLLKVATTRWDERVYPRDTEAEALITAEGTNANVIVRVIESQWVNEVDAAERGR